MEHEVNAADLNNTQSPSLWGGGIPSSATLHSSSSEAAMENETIDRNNFSKIGSCL